MKTSPLLPRRTAPRLAVLLAAALLGMAVRAQAEEVHVGLGPEALPAVHEVPVATPAEAPLAARAALGYAYTESVLDAGDSHHRTQLDVAASLSPASWFSGAVRILGRYDAHTGGADNGDYGVVTETQLSGRAVHALSERFRVGGRLGLWLPAADNVGHAFGATSGDVQALATYLPAGSPLTASAVLGLRLDRSRHAGGDPHTFSLSDRVALGTSDSTAAMHMGLGMTYRLASLELLAEWSYRMYFDYPGTSPMWVRAGVRLSASRLVQVEGLLGVSPSGRPKIDATAPLRVVEPRFAISVAATLAFPWEDHAAAGPAAPPPQAVRTTVIKGTVVSNAGAGIEGAEVSLASDAGSRDLTTGSSGEFEASDLEPGSYRLRVTARGWNGHEEVVEVARGNARQVRVALKRELPKGQIRGTVRKFNGQSITATISIAKAGIKELSAAEGVFEVNVPPGDYEVLVKARGYRSQTRRAHVEEDGVAILIVELEPSTRK